MEYLDAIRGFALFGILLVNMQGFKMPLLAYHPTELYLPGTANVIVHRLVDLLAAWKFIAIFSFLFGCGLAVQRDSLALQGRRNVAGVMSRRMLVMLVMGIIHGVVLWAGDVLALYALWGFLAILLLRLRARTLLTSAGVLYGLLLCLHFLPWLLGYAPTSTEGYAGWREIADAWIDCYADGSFSWIIESRLEEWKYMWFQGIFYAFPYSLVFCLAGMACGKSRLPLAPDHALRTARRWLLPGFCTGLVLGIYHIAASEFPSVIPGASSPLPALAATVGNTVLALAYLLGAALLFRSGRFQRTVERLAGMGRLSMSNYLCQSLAANAIFMSWGLGLYGKVTAPAGLLTCVAIYLLQVRLTTAWLRHFDTGPFEWLWRRCSYGALAERQTTGISQPLSPP